MDLPKNFCALGFFSNFYKQIFTWGFEDEIVCYRDLKCIPCSPFTRCQLNLFVIWLTLAQLVSVPAPTVIWVGAGLGSGLAPCSAHHALWPRSSEKDSGDQPFPQSHKWSYMQLQSPAAEICALKNTLPSLSGIQVRCHAGVSQGLILNEGALKVPLLSAGSGLASLDQNLCRTWSCLKLGTL